MQATPESNLAKREGTSYFEWDETPVTSFSDTATPITPPSTYELQPTTPLSDLRTSPSKQAEDVGLIQAVETAACDVCIEGSDNGHELKDSNIRRRLFEDFYTRKEGDITDADCIVKHKSEQHGGISLDQYNATRIDINFSDFQQQTSSTTPRDYKQLMPSETDRVTLSTGVDVSDNNVAARSRTPIPFNTPQRSNETDMRGSNPSTGRHGASSTYKKPFIASKTEGDCGQEQKPSVEFLKNERRHRQRDACRTVVIEPLASQTTNIQRDKMNKILESILPFDAIERHSEVFVKEFKVSHTCAANKKRSDGQCRNSVKSGPGVDQQLLDVISNLERPIHPLDGLQQVEALMNLLLCGQWHKDMGKATLEKLRARLNVTFASASHRYRAVQGLSAVEIDAVVTWIEKVMTWPTRQSDSQDAPVSDSTAGAAVNRITKPKPSRAPSVLEKRPQVSTKEQTPSTRPGSLVESSEPLPGALQRDLTFIPSPFHALHQQFQRYTRKTFSSLPIEQHLYNIIIRDLTPQELDPGYIYVYWNKGNFGYAKVGRTNRSALIRLREWKRQCKHDAEIIYSSPYKIPHVARIEKLVHAELREYRLEEKDCQGCGGGHCEWFDVSSLVVQQVVEKWTTWIETRNPYEPVVPITANPTAATPAPLSRRTQSWPVKMATSATSTITNMISGREPNPSSKRPTTTTTGTPYILNPSILTDYADEIKDLCRMTTTPTSSTTTTKAKTSPPPPRQQQQHRRKGTRTKVRARKPAADTPKAAAKGMSTRLTRRVTDLAAAAAGAESGAMAIAKAGEAAKEVAKAGAKRVASWGSA